MILVGYLGLGGTPQASRALHHYFVRRKDGTCLYGKGLAYIDAHLLASCALSRSPLWTFDRRLAKTAAEARIQTH